MAPKNKEECSKNCDPKILEMFTKECEQCGETGLVPNGLKKCLSCLRVKLEEVAKTDKLYKNQDICLMCGKIDRWSALRVNNLCWECMEKKSKRSLEKLLDCLTEEQKKLFEDYKFWSGSRTSAIMLD